MIPERVIVLTVDALNASHLPWHGYERETAPFLNRLAEDNVWFGNCYSASSHTREAMPAMLSGYYPREAIDRQYRMVRPSVAAGLGVSTAMFHSNPFISRAYGYGSGFETFDDDLTLDRHRLLVLGKRFLDKVRNRHFARASVINDRALDWLGSVDEDRLLLWNHYMDVHGPYAPPSDYRTRYTSRRVSGRRAQLLLQKGIRRPASVTQRERALLRDLYDGEIRYVDDQIRSFVESLKRRGMYDNSLLVVTSDHGEGLGSEGFYEHPRRLTDGLLHVPLILAGGSVPSIVVDSPVSVLDVPAMILSVFDQEAFGTPGIDLHYVMDDPGAFRDRIVFAQVTKKRGKGAEFFAAGTDSTAHIATRPGEASFSGDDPALGELRVHVGDVEYGDFDRVEADPDNPSLASRLRALGYLDR